MRRCSSVVKSVSGVSRRATAATCRRPMPDSSTCFAQAPSRRARVGGFVVVFDDGFDLRLLGVRPRERGEPGAQLRVGLGGPAPGQRAPRAVEQQRPSEPVVSGQQRGAPPRLERDLAGRSDVRYADVSQHFVEPLDGFLNRSTVHPRARWRSPKRPLHASTWAGAIHPGGRGPHLLLASAEAARDRGMHRAARRPG